MGEKRKPSYTMLLKKHGNDGKTKTMKVETFYRFLWPEENKCDGMWRLRINGKWFPRDIEYKKFYTKTQVKEMVFKLMK